MAEQNRAAKAAEANRKKLLASQTAADNRKKQQIAELRAQEEAKATGKAKRQADEQKAKALSDLRTGNAESERTAREFLRIIKAQYPDARIASQNIGDGVIMWQVNYTDSSGEVHREKWAYGY